MPKPAHRTGTYHVRAKRVRATAYLNPDTPCGKCGRTLAEHPYTKTGKPPSWDAGHIRQGDPTSPLRPEVASCNRAEGGAMTTAKRRNPLTTTTRW